MVKFTVGNPKVSTRASGQNLPSPRKIGLEYLTCLFSFLPCLYPNTEPRLNHPPLKDKDRVSRKRDSELPDFNLLIFLSRLFIRKQNPTEDLSSSA